MGRRGETRQCLQKQKTTDRSALWPTVSVGGDEGIVDGNVRPFIYSFFLLELFPSLHYYLPNCASLVVEDAWLDLDTAWPFCEGCACPVRCV